MKLYPIKNWDGYFLLIGENNIEVYSSWGRGVNKHLKKHSPTYKLSQRISKHGYVRVDLNIGPQGKKQVFLHRLIAETLIPNTNNLECVDHIDGNKLNNHPSNLQWITRGNNVIKSQSMGVWGTPPKSYEIYFKNNNKLIITNISDFSRKNGYNSSHLVAISKGKRKTHKDIILVKELYDKHSL